MESKSPPPLSQCIIVWAALLAGQGMVVLVSQTAAVSPLSPPDQSAPPPVSIDPRLWYVIAVVLTALAVIIPRLLLKSANRRVAADALVSERVKAILPVWLVRWALLESVTMIGFVASMLTTNPVAIYPFTAVSLLGFLLTFPTEARLSSAAV